jgi:hypothetical protein
MNIMCGIIEKLRLEGFKEGFEEERLEGTLEILADLVKEGILTIPEAAKRANMTETIFMENVERFNFCLDNE